MVVDILYKLALLVQCKAMTYILGEERNELEQGTRSSTI